MTQISQLDEAQFVWNVKKNETIQQYQVNYGSKFYEKYKHTDFFAEGVTNLTGKSGNNRLQLLREAFSYFKEKK